MHSIHVFASGPTAITFIIRCCFDRNSRSVLANPLDPQCSLGDDVARLGREALVPLPAPRTSRRRLRAQHCMAWSQNSPASLPPESIQGSPDLPAMRHLTHEHPLSLKWGRSLGIDSVGASGGLAVNRMRKNQGKTGPTRNNDRGFIGGGILSRPGSRRTRLRMELGLGVRGLVCGAC